MTWEPSGIGTRGGDVVIDSRVMVFVEERKELAAESLAVIF